MKTSNSSKEEDIWDQNRTENRDQAGLTQASERASDGLPQREKQADGRERFFSSTERTRILVPDTLSLDLVIRLDLVERAGF